MNGVNVNRGFNVWSYLWLVICFSVNVDYCQTKQVTNTWYIGCFVYNDEIRAATRPFHVDYTNPVDCARICMLEGFNYTVLSEDDSCQCLKGRTVLTGHRSDNCKFKCAVEKVMLPCGGRNACSVYSSKGPYIKNVRINMPSTKVYAGQPFRMKVIVTLASAADVMTGLEAFENKSLSSVAVTMKLGAREHVHNVQVIGRVGVVEIQHTFNKGGEMPHLRALAKNFLSSAEHRFILSVISMRPQGLHVQLASFYTARSSCSPKSIKDKIPPNANHVTVLSGDRVKLKAEIRQGVNLTFDWNFCFLERRRSTPHLEADGSCVPAPIKCTVDEQVIQLNRSQTCRVSVNASNHFGSVMSFIYVIAVAPLIKDVQVKPATCKEENCASDRWNTPIQSALPVPNDASAIPQLVPVDDNMGFPTTQPLLKFVGVYRTGTKVCFHATVNLVVRSGTKARIRFGDHESMSIDLGAPNWNTNMMMLGRKKRYIYPSTQNMTRFQPYRIDDNSPGDFASNSGFLSSKHGVNFTTCYSEYCTMNIFFSHIYKKSGFYVVDVQVSNSTYQMSARVEEAIRVIGDAKSTDTLICEALVRTGDLTSMAVRGAKGVRFVWTVDRRDDSLNPIDPNELQLSAHWKRIDKKQKPSPLDYTFDRPGVYFVRIIESQRYNIEQEFCLIFVEEEIDDVTVAIQPDVRYVTVGEVIRISVTVEFGSNFTVSLSVGNFTNTTTERHDAPYSETFTFIPNKINCQQVKVQIQNSVSLIDRVSKNRICSEETLSDLSVVAPAELETGQRANIIVAVQSGSNVEISLEVTCFLGSVLASYKNSTGSKTGPSIFNFTTKPFRRSGIFRVVARARNHVPTDKRHLVESTIITVGRRIRSLSSLRVARFNTSLVLNNQNNTIVAIVNGEPDNSTGILYKWEYPGVGGMRIVFETASSVAKLLPQCNTTGSECLINLTATSGISSARHVMTIVNSEDAEQLMEHPVTVALDELYYVKVDCVTRHESETGCRVKFAGDANVNYSFYNSTIKISHAFKSPGLWPIFREVIYSNGSSSTLTSYVSVQQKVADAKLKGETLVYLDATPTGEWRASAKQGSHLIFQWIVKRKNAPAHLTQTTKVSCEREFAYRFTQTGLYEVILLIHNDISSVNASLTVEVRHSVTHFIVQVEPVYLGDVSVFYLSANLTKSFTLTVRWEESEQAKSFTRDQLFVANNQQTNSSWSRYVLKHLYKSSGQHQFQFTFDWLAGSDFATRDIINYSRVYDVARNPPYTVAIKHDHDDEILTEPYHVEVGEAVVVELTTNKLAKYLNCLVFYEHKIHHNFSRNFDDAHAGEVYKIKFNATEPGSYRARISAKPGNLVTTVHVVAFHHISKLVLDNPTMTTDITPNIVKPVKKCEMRPLRFTVDGQAYACAPVLLTAHSNGHNVTFRFQIRNTFAGSNFVDLIEANTTSNGSDPTHINNIASLEYVFRREGAYNISVSAFTVDDHDEMHEVASTRTFLPFLFYAESLPSVYLPKSFYVVERDSPINIELIKRIPEQLLTVNWKMVEAHKTYYDAGYIMNQHTYRYKGSFTIHVEAYNRIGKTTLPTRVLVQERLHSATLALTEKVFSTNEWMRINVDASPPNAGWKYNWSFVNVERNLTIHKVFYNKPDATNTFTESGRYLVQVTVSNNLNDVTSNSCNITLLDLIEPFYIKAPKAVQAGKTFTVESALYNMFAKVPDASRRWTFGDDTEVLNKSSTEHVYTSTGIYTVTLSVWNSLKNLTEQWKVFVTQAECPLPDATLSTIPSQTSRSQHLYVEASVDFDCPQVKSIEYLWKVRRRWTSLTYSNPIYNSTEQILHLPPGLLDYGIYEISFNATLVGTVLFATANSLVRVEPAKLVAVIDGGTERKISRQQDLNIDASGSFDPDYPQQTNFKFSWECHVLHSRGKSCFRDLTNQPSERAFQPVATPMQRIASDFPKGILFNQSVLNIPGRYLSEESDTFVFVVNISKDGRLPNYATLVVKTTSEDDVANVGIRCPSCQQSSINPQRETLIFAECHNCKGGTVKYSWTISLVDDGADVIRNESSDCVPPSGKGWLPWLSNSTSNESLSLSDVNEAFLNQSSGPQNKPEHHDENFTGVLPSHEFNGRELTGNGFQQDDGINLNPSMAISSSWEDLGQDFPDASFDQDSFQDPYGSYQAYGNDLAQLYNAMPFGMYEDRRQAGPSPRESDPDEHTTGGRTIQNGIFGFNTDRLRTSGAPVFTGGVGLSLDMFRNSGRHSPMTGLSTARNPAPDKLMSASAMNNLPLDMHYQDYVSEKRDFDEMARVPNVSGNENSGKVIVLRSNKFLEGRTYAITADVTHRSESGEVLKRGSSTYYVHVIRGPSMGSCSVVAKNDGKNTHHVHCMGWKNVGRKTSDPTTMDKTINYEIKYSLGPHGKKRTLYFGSNYERSFTLPESDEEVYVHVTVYNSAGVSTKVCSFPANITSTKFLDLRDRLDLHQVYLLAVGNTSQLYHLMLRDDDNAILGLINVILDLMPEVAKLQQLSESSIKYRNIVKEVTSNLVNALSNFRCLRMTASCDMLEALSRILKYRDFMDDNAVIHAANLLSGVLARSKLLANDETRLPGNRTLAVWNQIGDEISKSGVVNEIMKNAMSALSHMISFNATLREKTGEEHRRRRSFNGESDVNNLIANVEESLRDFYLDRVKYRTMMFGPCRAHSDQLHMLVQLANRSITFNTDEEATAEAEFPPESYKKNRTLFQTAIAYTNTIPYRSDKNVSTEMSNGAISMWVMDEKSEEVHVKNLREPITIVLPTRTEKRNTSQLFSNKVMQNKLSQHDFYVHDVDSITWHISLNLDETSKRPFPVAITLTDHPLAADYPLNDTQIVTRATLPKLSRTTDKTGKNHSVKFMLKPGSLLAPGRFYVTIFNPDMPKTKLRRRATIPVIPYNLRVWGSDCYHWASERNVWNNSDCKVLNTSTFEQTICSTTHLSTYSSSFKNIETILLMRDFILMTQPTALSPCLTVVVAVVCFFLTFLAIHRFVLRRPDTNSDYDEITGTLRSPGLGSWLKWMFGADDRGASGRVPIVLKDNRPDHKQIFEVTVHTANWPGSGTSSMVNMLMYGLDGKYEARELCAPSEYDSFSPNLRSPTNSCFFKTGSIKTFIVTFKKNLGSLWKICFWHDHSGPRPRWHLDYVIVRDVTSGERWFFPCDTWLALDRGSNRISRELRAMESKPSVLRHLAMRAKNMILDYHSMISILACARWGVLTRAQRIVHIMTLCMVIFTLASVKTILEESDMYAYDVSCFSGENLLWGFIIGAASSAILLPAQLIFRFTKQDDRISVMMEDSTSNSAISPTTNMSRVSLPNKSGRDLYSGHGGLHKTATVTHNFAELDEILSEEQEMPNKFVTDWLQRKEWATTSRQSINNEINDQCTTGLPGSVTSLDTSVSSYDEEIARCMAHDTSASTCPTDIRCDNERHAQTGKKDGENSTYYHDSVLDQSFISVGKSVPSIYVEDAVHNDEIQEADDSADKPSLFAMDGPELVPCEKLDPIHQAKTAPLPRQCSFIAWAYYVATLLICALCTVYGAEKYLVDTDFDRWIETSCFALFWTVVVIEILFVFVSTFVATLRSFLSRSSEQSTLEELFPTVDSAQVDDYAYKYYSEYGVVSDADSDTITESEMKMRLSERRRSRYLRNMLPPYDEKGKWRNKNHPLRKTAKQMRRSAAAKRALLAWCGLFFLSLVLVAITISQDAGNQGRYGHKSHVTNLFHGRFCLAQGYLLSSNCSYNASQSNFPDIANHTEWKSWFQRSFLHRNENLTANHETSVLLGTVKMTLYRRHVASKCDHLTERMKKILNMSSCKPSAQNVSKFYQHPASNTKYEIKNTMLLDFLHPSAFENVTIVGDAVKIDLLVYNTMTKHYTTVEAFTEFPWGIHPYRNRLQVNSVNLEIANSNARNALTFCHAVLVVWVAWSAVKQFIIIITNMAVSKEQREELSKRSLLPTHVFMKVLSFAVWLVIVLYLLSSTILRANLLQTADYFTVTGHAGRNYDEFLQAILTSEIVSRQLLAAWTVLVVVQCINLIVSWHGSGSKFTKALSALCGSFKSDASSVYILFAVFLFILSAVGYLFFGTTLFYHATASQALMRTTSWSAGVTKTVTGKSNLEEAKKRSGILLSILYFGFVFIVMRVIMKGFIVSSFQRKLCCTKRGKKNKDDNLYTKAGKKGKTLSTSTLTQSKTQRATPSTNRYVLFSDMLHTTWQELSNGVKIIVATLFCGNVPGAFQTVDAETSSYSQQSSSRESVRTVSDRKFYMAESSLEKRKLGPLEVGVSSHGTTSGFVEGSTWGVITPGSDSMSIPASDAYALSGEAAMSEAELQVRELCQRATELIDDAMSNMDDFEMPNAEKLTKTISNNSVKFDPESEISKLSRQLADFVRRHGDIDDDADTVVTSSTLAQDINSPWSFVDDNESQANNSKADRDHSSTTSNSSLRFGSEALLYSQKPLTSLSKLNTSTNQEAADHGSQSSGISTKSPKEHRTTKGERDRYQDVDQPGAKLPKNGSSSDTSEQQGLTTFNLACHDRRLTLLRQKLARRAAGVQQTPVETLSSVSTESKSSIEEQSSDGNGGRVTLWQALMRAKHRHKKTTITPMKPRPLRRSQTIFVNAKKLPVCNFLPSSNTSDTHKTGGSSEHTPKFATAFAATEQPAAEVNPLCETPAPNRQPDFCEEERTIPGLVPEDESPSSHRATVITKRTALIRNRSVPAKFSTCEDYP
uniref:Polycystic kidney disease 1-related protein-like n=1 Tax=Phallusia mammillata TaxID=59560 RepID=A0A6F9DF54_9ASCI|nr:polycystic kidney disease 1-related protein-like [Phallusia mammillata]